MGKKYDMGFQAIRNIDKASRAIKTAYSQLISCGVTKNVAKDLCIEYVRRAIETKEG